MANKKKKPKVGRPAYEPNDKDRLIIKLARALNYNQQQCCEYLGITDKTFTKYYRKDWEHSILEKKIQLMNTALSVAIKEKQPAVLIFLLKSFCGLREINQIEATVSLPDVVVVAPEEAEIPDQIADKVSAYAVKH